MGTLITGTTEDDNLHADNGVEADTVNALDGPDDIYTNADEGDLLIGGLGNDVYFVFDAASGVITTEFLEALDGGIDRIILDFDSFRVPSFTLPDNIEQLIVHGAGAGEFIGTDENNFLKIGFDQGIRGDVYGLGGDDTIQVNRAGHIFGGDGDDTVTVKKPGGDVDGGAGDDLYNITGNTMIIEAADGGYDTVRIDGSHTLADNVEKLVLTFFAFESTGVGNALDNLIWGNDSENTLNGAAGADTMRGADGDDTYVVNDAGDVVVEVDDQDSVPNGIDLVRSSVDYLLATDVENLQLSGTGDIRGRGNGLDNRIVGNKGDNALNGAAGDDVLVGGLGGDTLTGGQGEDRFEFGPSFGVDRLRDFQEGDVIAFDTRVFADFDDVMAHTTQVGGFTVIDAGDHGRVLLSHTDIATLDAADFDFFAA